MGVKDIDYVNIINLDMSEATLCSGASVSSRFSIGSESDRATSRLKSCVTEDLQALKAKMKWRAAQFDDGEFRSFHIDSFSPVLMNRHVATCELSSSLPNLSTSQESIVNRINDKVTRNSLSNIHSNGPELEVKALGGKLDCERGQPDGASQSESPSLVRPRKPQMDLPINVDTNNSRLYAVLENIPLYYIPHTKQLVSLNSKQECEQESGQTAKSQSSPNNPYPNHPASSTPAVTPTHSSCSSCTTPIQEPLQNGHARSSHVPEEACAMEVKNGYMCSGSDFETSTMLSQDSDSPSLCHSDHTVIHDTTCKVHLDVQSVDLDEVNL